MGSAWSSLQASTLRTRILVAVVVLFIAIWLRRRRRLVASPPVHLEGFVEPGFEAVREAFRKNLEDGWERDGGAFAVYRDGKKVVDLWGGYADKAAERLWTEDTLAVTFSSTKGVAAVCVALLVDRGLLSYDDLVAKHWPAFGKNGKENITVQMLLSHQGGLAYFDEWIPIELAKDPEQMRIRIENERPKWTPGTESGYHSFTFGWLVDQLIRQVDPKHRGIGDFFREELAEVHDIDFHIGLSVHDSVRVARITRPSMSDRLSEMRTDIRAGEAFLKMHKVMTDTPLARNLRNVPWLQPATKMNSPDIYRLEQAAALGIGNARSLAKLFDLVATERLFSPEVNVQLQRYHTDRVDYIMGDSVPKGNGFYYHKIDRAGTEYAVGHAGFGGQHVQYDTKNRLTIAYVSNGLKAGGIPICRTYARLEDAVYTIVENDLKAQSKANGHP